MPTRSRPFKRNMREVFRKWRPIVIKKANGTWTYTRTKEGWAGFYIPNQPFKPFYKVVDVNWKTNPIPRMKEKQKEWCTTIGEDNELESNGRKEDN